MLTILNTSVDIDSIGNKENSKQNKSKASTSESANRDGLVDHNNKTVEQKQIQKRKILIPEDDSEDSGDEYEPGKAYFL